MKNSRGKLKAVVPDDFYKPFNPNIFKKPMKNFLAEFFFFLATTKRGAFTMLLNHCDEEI